MIATADPTLPGRRLRKRARLLFWLGSLAFIALAPVAYLFPSFYEGIATSVFWWWAAPCFAVVVLSGLYLHNAKCPRCSSRFAVRSDGMRWNDFTNKCLNCGLDLHDNAKQAL